MNSPEKLRIMLVDDHVVMREGLAALVNSQPDMEVIEEASDGRVAVEKAQRKAPDVVVMDVSLPRLSGTAATGEILKTNPRIRVLALSMHENGTYLRDLLEAGAAGYVVKRSAANELIRAVRIVADGGVYLDPALAGRVVNRLVNKSSLRGEMQGTGLSEREEEVLRLIAHGYSNKEIAAQLALSVKTVETYKARSTEKLGLNSRVDIVRYARDCGWLEDF